MAFSLSSYMIPNYQPILPFFDSLEDFPGPRCGHTLTAVDYRLVLFGGITAVRSDGSVLSEISLQGVTNAVHCFNLLNRKWKRVFPDGEAPSPRANHAAVAFHSKLYVQGGIGPDGSVNGDLYILDMNNDKLKWERVAGPGPRYGHVMGLVGDWLVVFGGKYGYDTLDDTWALDLYRPPAWERLNPDSVQPTGRMYAAAGNRHDGLFVLCGGKDSSGATLGDAYGLQMVDDGRWMWTSFPGVATSQRCHHTAVFVNARLHVTGGSLIGHNLIDAVSAVAVLDTSDTPAVWWGRFSPATSNRGQFLTPLMRRCRHAAASVGCRIYVYGGIGGPEEGSLLLEDLLVSDDDLIPPSSKMDRSLDAPANLPTVDDAFHASPVESFGRFRQRIVDIPNERLGNRARRVTMDRYENERRRVNDLVIYSYLPPFTGKKSTQDLVEKVISTLLKPDSWEPPADRTFFLSYPEVEELCHAAIQIFIKEPTALQLNLPIKVFGDLHGQFAELMDIFRVYGEPSAKGDIESIDYLFLGDYVDRGKYSLETIILLLALKVKYPEIIHLVRGNHESTAMNSVYGFKVECEERMGKAYGLQAWQKINLVFDHLPLAAVIEHKIFCVHGGIGTLVETIEDVSSIQRPILLDNQDESLLAKELLWSDPTADESILGIHKSDRGEGLVTFGPDIVEAFCLKNNLDMIIRAHQCVNGFVSFAQGRMITVFSAASYCGGDNAGAILMIDKDCMIYPKLIHPKSPPDSSSDTATMQEQNSEVLSFPVGRGPNPGYERGSDSS